MLIKNVVEIENGMVEVQVVDQSGFISSYRCNAGEVTRLMKELRGNM